MEWDLDAQWTPGNAVKKAGNGSSAFHLSVLFLVVFSLTYFGYYELGRIAFGPDANELNRLAVIVHLCMYLVPPIVAAYAIVAYFRLRATWTVGCIACLAGIAGAGLAVYMVSKEVEPTLSEVDHIRLEGIKIRLLPIPGDCGGNGWRVRRHAFAVSLFGKNPAMAGVLCGKGAIFLRERDADSIS